MEIKNVKSWATAGPEPYYVSFAGFLVAFGLRYIMQPLLDDHIPMLLFAINSIVIAYYYGFWPSFLMLILSFPTAFYFFAPPYNTFSLLESRDIYGLLIYTSITGLAAFMIELLRREQYKSNLLARVSDSRYRLLVEADEDRRAAMKKNDPPLFS